MDTKYFKYIIGVINVYSFMIKGLYHSLEVVDISILSLKHIIGIIHDYSYTIKGLYHSL